MNAFSLHKAPILLFCQLLVTLTVAGQPKSDVNSATEPVLSSPKVSEIAKHSNLETEIEFYPFNMVVPSDPVVKNEVMFDFHKFHHEDKLIGGIRFFADANTHWASTRDMKDLIMYTEVYYGFKHFQLGMETGSVTGKEYISIGPQYVAYDTKLFRRAALVSRVAPDFVLGYEFTSQEFDISKSVKLSSTGMGRMVFPSYQTVCQVSLWTSFAKLKGIYFGLEYEYNSATFYNDWKYTTNHELFLGIKAELH